MGWPEGIEGAETPFRTQGFASFLSHKNKIGQLPYFISWGHVVELIRTIFINIEDHIYLPDINGIDFISQLHDNDIETPIVIITVSSQYEIARQAVRLGAYD